MRYSGPGFVIYNGRPVLQVGKADFGVDSGNKDVDTLLLGRAGHSAGPLKTTLSFNSAIPLSGLEVDWVGICAAQEQIDIGFKIANTTYNMTGDLRTAKLGTSVDAANMGDFEFHGTLVNTVSAL